MKLMSCLLVLVLMMMTNSIWKIYMQILNEKESKNLLNKRKKKMKNIVLWLSIRNHQRLLISHPKTQVRYKLLDRGQKVIQTATGAKASFHSYTSNSASHTDSRHLDSTLLIVRSILDLLLEKILRYIALWLNEIIKTFPTIIDVGLLFAVFPIVFYSTSSNCWGFI